MLFSCQEHDYLLSTQQSRHSQYSSTKLKNLLLLIKWLFSARQQAVNLKNTGSWSTPLASCLQAGDGPTQATPTMSLTQSQPGSRPQKHLSRQETHLPLSVAPCLVRSKMDIWGMQPRPSCALLEVRIDAEPLTLLASLPFAVGLGEFAYPAHLPVFALRTWPGPPSLIPGGVSRSESGNRSQIKTRVSLPWTDTQVASVLSRILFVMWNWV